ncbi:DUF3857 domain-containing protein [Winogradskyella bathintestinalis]|uniref:DUF3857 domain-containing protein n=1 Tax=Winogradskyella bathintestinalis TaxID=3035208 RepID=A0ABT7ZYD5_9FLAO|nr:DUF3857 domain-containing protein [Winogradskyella bathintestinalis]MDN3493999.1 DUF3857 domain-containing protein [Winogradskyella bathintestinalis]
MRDILFLFAVCATFLCASQNYDIGMAVHKNELKATTYAKDSTANAVVIYDYGNSFVNEKTFWLNVEVEQKIKILRPEGIARGEFEIKLYKGKSSKEKIDDIKGTTYNLENGKIVKSHLTKNAIFEIENDNYTLVKFVLPNLKIGSIITISYTTKSRFMSKYQPWYFQSIDPVMYSEYNTSIPGNYNYHVKLVGEISLDTNESIIKRNCLDAGRGAYAHCSVNKYVMTDIPAYKPEGFTTTSRNYMARIEYELSVFKGFDGSVDKITKTWRDADNELKTDLNFGRQLGKKGLVKNLLPAEISSIDNPLEKANRIYQYVLNNYKWNGKSERYDVSLKSLIKEKTGSAFEINLLLANLLSYEDIDVFPVLMSTRENGLVTRLFPVLSEFNYVILKVIIDNITYYLDATNSYRSFGELPFRALNQYGRLIDFDEGSDWEDIEVTEISSRTHRIAFSSFEDDEFYGTIESGYSGYHSHGPKQQFDENASAYFNQKANNLTDINIENHEVLDFDKTKSTFNEKMDISLTPEFIGNKIYLNPFILKFFDENPFKLQERTYPIDFGYKDSYSYSMKINLDNLVASELPESVTFTLPNNAGRLLFNIKLVDNDLLIFFKAYFHQSIYNPNYYPYLKEFMNKVVELQNNTLIVLEKQ